MQSEGNFSIGLDLGGTNLRAAAVDRSGKLLDSVSGKTRAIRRPRSHLKRNDRRYPDAPRATAPNIWRASASGPWVHSA